VQNHLHATEITYLHAPEITYMRKPPQTEKAKCFVEAAERIIILFCLMTSINARTGIEDAKRCALTLFKPDTIVSTRFPVEIDHCGVYQHSVLDF
jgi:hypothetical protein